MKLNFKIIPVVLVLFSCCKGGLAKEINNNDIIDKESEIVKLNKKSNIPALTNTTCGDNTKVCNIGFGEIKVSIYDLIWYLSTPKATIDDTKREEKSDYNEYVSMVGKIRNYNVQFDVHIYGEYDSGVCYNDKSNKCTIDTFLYEPSNSDGALFTLDNLEDKSVKYARFKYSDWTGKCYKTWRLTFDIQASREDLTRWYWYDRIDLDQYY